MTQHRSLALNRADGALTGLALGDALGMPTQYFSRAKIQGRYGILDAFFPGPNDNDISRGMPAGHVTDDTDQAVILGELLVAGHGTLDSASFAAALLAWQDRMSASGSLDLLGPSTVRALALVSEGVSPEHTGRWGDTNGASMRIAPVGIAVSTDSVEHLVDEVESASRVTHNTGVAIAGAAAVAAAVSSGIAGNSFDESLSFAVTAAERGSERGYYIAGADVAARIGWAVDLVQGVEPEAALEIIYRLIGVGVATQEAVPAAFAVATLFPDDLWATCRYAASLGGDCDTIAAIAGAIVGAHIGIASVPHPILHQLATANPGLNMPRLAGQLLDLRATNRRKVPAEPHLAQPTP